MPSGHYADGVPDPIVLGPAAYDHPDAVALTALAQEYYRDIYGGEDSNPIAATEFVPPDGEFLIGYLGGEPVAMGGWRRFAGPVGIRAQRPGEIRRMFVHPQRRRTGLGRALLAAIEASAVRNGIDVLLLETGLRQPEAIALYRAAGYADVEPFGYWAGDELAVHLARRLTQVSG